MTDSSAGPNDLFSRWIRDNAPARGDTAIPAATVILIRDGGSGLETALMRRNSRVSFAEGMWVFPGGRIDPADHPAEGPDLVAAALTAAVREAEEEAGLRLDPSTLLPYAHWLPPLEAPKRFTTWFFLARAPEAEVLIDDGEIVDHDWLTPEAALGRHAAGRIELLPPTWMTLHDLAQFATVDACLAAVADRSPAQYATHIIMTSRGGAAAWEGDVAYHDPSRADEPGPRHRLVMAPEGWILEHDR